MLRNGSSRTGSVRPRREAGRILRAGLVLCLAACPACASAPMQARDAEARDPAPRACLEDLLVIDLCDGPRGEFREEERFRACLEKLAARPGAEGEAARRVLGFLSRVAPLGP